VTAGSQRFTQGEIDNFELELLHLLMQHPPCPDKAMQSLEALFRFSNLRTPKSTLFGWAITLVSSNGRSSSKSLKSLLLILAARFALPVCIANLKEVNNSR
jgi:hypothetical protein